MSEIRVVIGMPLVESIKMETVISLLGITSNVKQSTSVIFVKGSLIHDARKSIVLKAQSVGATHLLFMDSDMTAPNDTIDRLLAHGKDIVGVNSHTKSIPTYSTVKMINDEGKIIVENNIPKELFKVYACGTGILLVTMRVFDIIDKPWFFYDPDEKAPISEDVWFCRQAQRKGIEVFCDPTLKIGHVGSYEY